MRLKTKIVTPTATLALRNDMLKLYQRYYQVEPNTFLNRFQSNDLYALYKSGGELVGFTGFRMKEVPTPEGPVKTIYLGQTVMDAQFRGKSILPRTCTRLIFLHLITKPWQPLFIWCDALTYKPYLLFSRSTKEYFPSRLVATPEKVKNIMNFLGKEYYGTNYDPERGTVHKTKNIINDPTAIIGPMERENADIDFFARVNPHHADGHGLLTITPMNWTNFLFLLKKCIRKALKS